MGLGIPQPSDTLQWNQALIPRAQADLPLPTRYRDVGHEDVGIEGWRSTGMEHVDAGWRSSGMEKHGDKDRACEPAEAQKEGQAETPWTLFPTSPQ